MPHLVPRSKATALLRDEPCICWTPQRATYLVADADASAATRAQQRRRCIVRWRLLQRHLPQPRLALLLTGTLVPFAAEP
jgi:hypothetical protein